ncbi:hypothetical protein [Georgenia faecalis]|uniref:Oligosaccharide flippase family protein n=1 Tax=Georgenia faecalis TaxID=2483799 RepID=A0ABV9D767_9MICO|nr:hypothetical protein [Georgenia faecalis]
MTGRSLSVMFAANRIKMLSALDIGFTSAFSMVASVAAARALGVEAFGFFAVLWTLTLGLQAVAQGGYVDVLLRLPRETSAAAIWGIDRWAAPVLGVFAALVILLTAFSSYNSLALIAAGTLSAYLLIRHTWTRAYMHSQGDAALSTAISAILAIGSVVCLFGGVAFDLSGPWYVVCCILAPYSVASLLSLRYTRSVRADYDPSVRIWRWDYAMESALLVSSLHVASVMVVPALGLEFSAGVRGANLLLGPLSVLFGSLRLILLPAFAGRSMGLRSMAAPAVIILLAAGLWASLGWALLGAVGSSILGDALGATITVFPWVAATYLLQGVYMVLFFASRAWVLDVHVRRARAVMLIATGAAVAVAHITKVPDGYFVGTLTGSALAIAILASGVSRNARRASARGRRAPKPS